MLLNLLISLTCLSSDTYLGMNHVLLIYNLDVVKAVKEAHAKIQNDERLEKERLEEKKQISDHDQKFVTF